MSEPLDLDAIEGRANAAPSGSRCVCAWQMAQARWIAGAQEDTLALVAEVRRLRDALAVVVPNPFDEEKP